ncbi:TrbI/VirB10 family protein [Hydrogenivirga sp.]
MGVGSLTVLLVLALFRSSGPTVVTSPDVEVVNKVMREQLKLQKEMQKQLIKEIRSIKEEIEKQKQSQIPASSSKEEMVDKDKKGVSVFDLLKRRDRKRKSREEASSSMEIIKLKEELRRLQEELEERKSRRRGKRGTEPVRIEIKEREVKLIKAGKLAKKKTKKKKKVFIPAGSVMRGRIVSAFFAPVGDTQKFPAVLIELKGDAVTPNNFRFPLEGCRVIAKAEGDWVLERAKLETYKLACVFPNGKVVETKFAGKVVSGVDGGEGVKGKFVNASAKQLRTYFGTTFLGTLFESLAQAQVDTQMAVEGGAVFQSQVIKNEGEYAFYSAMADTWKQFSQFYLNQAKKALPVVLVDGNVPIYIEVIDGFSLGVGVDEVAGLYR